MERYKVIVTEYLRRAVEVEADSEDEAYRKAFSAWQDGTIYLGGRDYDGADVCVIGLYPDSEETGGDCIEYTYQAHDI